MIIRPMVRRNERISVVAQINNIPKHLSDLRGASLLTLLVNLYYSPMTVL